MQYGFVLNLNNPNAVYVYSKDNVTSTKKFTWRNASKETDEYFQNDSLNSTALFHRRSNYLLMIRTTSNHLIYLRLKTP